MDEMFQWWRVDDAVCDKKGVVCDLGGEEDIFESMIPSQDSQIQVENVILIELKRNLMAIWEYL